MMSDKDFMRHEDMVCETIYRRDYDDYKIIRDSYDSDTLKKAEEEIQTIRDI